MNREALAQDILAAARTAFSTLLAQHDNETFYAFALYTDEDCYTVVPAANSLEQYQAKIAKTGDTDPAQLAYYKWASAEWAYESFAADPFDAICERLRHACDAVSDDEAAFSAFKADVHHAMIDALQRLDDTGFFGERRHTCVLFITSSDYDEAVAMEDRSASMLNPPEIQAAFQKRYPGTA